MCVYVCVLAQSNILAVSPALPRGMRRSMWSVNDFKLHKCLHKGYASHVYAADCKTTGLKVVLKVYRLAAQCDLQRVQLYREICVHSRLQHQNIIQFYSAFLVRHTHTHIHTHELDTPPHIPLYRMRFCLIVCAVTMSVPRVIIGERKPRMCACVCV